MAKEKKKSKKDKKDKKSKKSKKSSGAPASASESGLSQAQGAVGATVAGSLFDAGQLFERYARPIASKNGRARDDLFADGAVVEREDFLKLMQELSLERAGGQIRDDVTGPRAFSPTARIAPSPRTQFDAGRLFERFDRTKSGLIDRATFLQIMSELRVGVPDKTAASVSEAQLPTPGQGVVRSSVPSQLHSEIAVGTGSEAVQTDGLVAVHPHLVSNLLHKKEQLVFQARCVQTRMEQVRAWKRSIERETLSDVEAMLQRLGSEEAFKLSLLEHDAGALRRDINEIDSFVRDISSADPLKALDSSSLGSVRSLHGKTEQSRNSISSRTLSSSGRGSINGGAFRVGLNHLRSFDREGNDGVGKIPTSTKSTAESQMDPLALVRLYPELCSMAERLAVKPFKRDIDVMHDDFPREMLDRLEKANAYEQLLQDLEAKQSQIAEGEREIALLREARSHMVEKVERFTADIVRQLGLFVKMYDDTNTKKTFLEKVLMLTERQLGGESAADDVKDTPGGFSAKDLSQIKEAVAAWMQDNDRDGEGKGDAEVDKD